MIPILYKETETEFQSNGIAQLSDMLITEVTEGLNGEFELYSEYPANGRWAKEIKEFRYIQAKPNDQDEDHAFRIYEVEKEDDPDTIRIYATSKSNDLGNDVIERLRMTNSTVETILRSMKSRLTMPTNYTFISDITKRRDVDWEMRNPLNCIMGEQGSIVDIFGGEIKKTNDYIYIYKRRGRDNVTTIRQDKSLEGFKQTVSTKGLTTKIIPFISYYNSDSEGESKPVTIKGSIVVSNKDKNYPLTVIKPVDFGSYSDEILVEDNDGKVDEVATKAKLQSKANTYFTSLYTEVDTPRVEIEVDLYQLSDDPNYEKFKDLETIGIGDTIDAWVKSLDIDVNVKVKELRYDSLGERVLSLRAGSMSTSAGQAQRNEYSEAISHIDRYLSNGIDHIVQTASNNSNKIWTGTSEPTEGMREGDTWFKPLPDSHMAIYNYDGIEWVFVLDTTDTEVNKILIDEAKKEIGLAVEAADKANKAIQDSIDEAGFTTLPELTTHLGTVASRADAMSITAKNRADKAVADASTAQGTADKAVADASTAQGTADTALTDASKALTDVGTLDGRVTSVVSDIDGELSRKTNKTDHDALKGTVTTQGTAISQNATDISSKVEKTVVDTLNNTVETQGTAISQNATDITSKAATTTVNALTGRVSTAESGITQNANAIKLKASQTDVDGISGRVDTAESSLSVLPGQIASKASQTSVNTLTGRVSTAESGITQNANDIKLRATSTTVNALSGRVSTAESQLTVQAGQISSKVSQAEVDASIDGIEVGGRNLLKNTNSELNQSTANGWGDINIYTMTDESNRNLLSSKIVERNASYVFRVWLDATNSDYRVLAFVRMPSATSPYRDVRGNAVEAGESGYSTIKFTVPDNAIEVNIYSIRFNQNNTPPTVIGAKWEQLEKGNKATDWTPAPEDTDAKISYIETEWTQTFDTFSQTVAGIDGRVTSQKQTIDGISRTVSGHGGRLSTVEQTASGLQTTVASKASQTQVTQLATLVDTKVTSSQVNSLIKTDKTIKDTRSVNSPPSHYFSSYSRETVREFKNLSTMGISGEGTYGILESIVPWTGTTGGGIKQTLTTDHGVWERSGSSSWTTWKKTADRTWVGAQISVLEDNINLKVSKGDVMSQINVEAGRTLISSGKVLINATTTTITGTAFIDGAVMKTASMDGAVIKNATIASAKIANLDANKITTGTLEGVEIIADRGYIADFNIVGGSLSSLTPYGYTTVKGTGDVAFATASPEAGSTTGANLQIWHNGNLRFGTNEGLIHTNSTGQFVIQFHGDRNQIYRNISNELQLTSQSHLTLYPAFSVRVRADSIRPHGNGSAHCGMASYRWDGVYVNSKGVSQSSDLRLKKNVIDIPNILTDGIEQVKPKMYEVDGELQFGYIAQDMERVLFKYAIEEVGFKQARQYMKKITVLEEEDDSYKALRYSQMEVLKGAHRDKRISENAGKITYIEDEVTQLKNRIKQLEEQLNEK